MNIRVSFSLALTACLVRQIIATEWEGVGLLISLLACLDEGNCLEGGGYETFCLFARNGSLGGIGTEFEGANSHTFNTWGRGATCFLM